MFDYDGHHQGRHDNHHHDNYRADDHHNYCHRDHPAIHHDGAEARKRLCVYVCYWSREQGARG